MHNQKTVRACRMILAVFGRWDKESYRLVSDGEIMDFSEIYRIKYFCALQILIRGNLK
jgi:hypothetical protein